MLIVINNNQQLKWDLSHLDQIGKPKYMFDTYGEKKNLGKVGFEPT